MQSAAYIHGALDAFVKAGEMSPAFAAGVADVLTKEAGIFSSVGDDVLSALKQYRKDHPDAWDPVAQRLNITPEDAYALVDDGRSFWTGIGRRSKDYWGNRLRKWKSRIIPGRDAMTPEDYDAELQDRRNRFMRDYIAQARAENLGLPLGLEAALQDKFVGDAAAGYGAARHRLDPVALRMQYGKDADAYADKFRNRYGAAAMREGIYEPRHDIKTVTPAPAVQSVHDDPRAYAFGDQGRATTFKAPRQRGLGEY